MAAKLIDLQLIYGIAGAREKFEDLASQLVKAEQTKAQKVRVERGDGGIDVFVGDLSDPMGIDVFQCKFFPAGLGDSQKDQIRESFKRCRDSTTFKTKRWTLCLPIDLSLGERGWFEEWRSRLAESGIEIEDPWGATKLEGLLYQPKSRGLRESFFNEEHLKQIRETHGLVQNLVNRTGTEEQLQRRAVEVSRQATYVKEFVDGHRDHHLAALNQAAASCTPPEKPPAHWEVVIRPSSISQKPRVDTLNGCWSIVETASARTNGWVYPVVNLDGRENGADWVGVIYTRGLEVESWRFSQNGVFAHAFPIWDDVAMRGRTLDYWPWRLPEAFVPERFLDLDNAIRIFTHIFRFAANLAGKAFDPQDETIHVAIGLRGTRDRVIMTWNDPQRMQECHRATAPTLENTWQCRRAELVSDPDDLAVTAALWFFERFNFHYDLLRQVVTSIQQNRFGRQG